MSRPYYNHQGHGAGIPEYYASDQSPRQQSHIPHSRDRMRGPPPMRLNNPAAANGGSPRRPQEPPLQQQYYAPSDTAWETSQNYYSGSGYDYEEDYSQNDQWPLPAQPHAISSPSRGSPRRPQPRPQRADEQPQQPDYQHRILDQPRSTPHADPGGRHYRQPAPAPASHHGSGQWNGEGYSYAAPPPNFPLSKRPPASVNAPPPMPTYAGPQGPQQAVYGRANQRPPLGPPPSARRGPPSYYPQVGPVMPIVEETDSMRGSSLRTGSVHTGGHDSKTSFASSNAIPIGISQLHLERGREAGHQPLQRPELLSESEDEDFDESPTEPAIARGVIRNPEPHQQYRDQPSPEGTVVRQASLGKKSKPTLTTFKSNDRIRKGSGSAANEPTKSSIASLPIQQQPQAESTQDVPGPASNSERTERSRALAQERLEGQARPGASAVPVQEDQRDVAPSAAIAAAASYVQESGSRSGSGKQTPEVLPSGTGVIAGSDSSDSEGNDLRRKRSKDLLGAELSNQLHPVRSQPRSPLAPAVDPRVESIIGSLEKGGAISAQEAEELKQPTGGLPDSTGKHRPPRINVDAVREAEARGSLTSLPDLIRRATKLASNLDRGKTASRLGMNWLDGAGDGEKGRSGSVPDILVSYPAPSLATPPESRNGRWSSRFRHSALPSDSDAGEARRKRSCCGIPLWLFWLLLVLLFLLTAAAVAVPVVLIVIPNQNDNTSSTKVGACEQKLTCNNGGTNILSSSGHCECLCINGYTGPSCSVLSNSGCTSISVGSSENATIGDAVPRLLDGADSNFSIPLDAQELLGLFSSSDMDCSLQNSLVTFNGKSQKRSSTDSLAEIDRSRTSDKKQEVSAVTSNRNIYALRTATPAETAATVDASAGSIIIADESRTLDFARVAILYIFQASQDLTIAADAQENLQTFLRTGYTADTKSSASNVTLGNGYTADLESYVISVGNGTSVGGTASTKN